MKCPTTTALNVRFALRSKSHKLQKEGTVTFYGEAVTYFLETYAKDDDIAQTDASMMHFAQASKKWPTESAKALWNKELRCNKVYDKYTQRNFY